MNRTNRVLRISQLIVNNLVAAISIRFCSMQHSHNAILDSQNRISHYMSESTWEFFNSVSWDTLFHSLYVPGIEVFNTSMVPGHDFLFLLNRQLWFCGEVVTTCLLDRSVKMFPWMRFVNLYSISEAHDVAGSDLSEYYKSQVGKKLES